MDIKDAVKIMKEFNAKEYRGRALQVLIDYYESSQAKIKELETALDTAHKIFGSESDRLGAIIKGLGVRPQVSVKKIEKLLYLTFLASEQKIGKIRIKNLAIAIRNSILKGE